jgi:hypothetical protein
MSNPRMRVTIAFEYEAKPINYDDPNPAAMAALDQASYRDDWGFLFDDIANHDPTITVEVVDDGRDT